MSKISEMVEKMEKSEIHSQPRRTVPLVTRADTVSDELKARTLGAMERREGENAQKAKEKAERRARISKNVLRVAAVAAVLALIVAVTPMRGYVVSAAESAWNGIIEWIDGHGWINPFYKALDGFSEFPYDSQGGATRNNVNLTTQTISSDTIDFDEDFRGISFCLTKRSCHGIIVTERERYQWEKTSALTVSTKTGCSNLSLAIPTKRNGR